MPVWLHLPASVWDDLSTLCVPFQGLYFQAGLTEMGDWLGAAHTDAPNPACHITICGQHKLGQMYLAAKVCHLRWFSVESEAAAGMTDQVQVH